MDKEGEDFLIKKYDKRHLFKFDVPKIAPKDMVIGKRHEFLCKICYEQPINMALMPCRHEHFCYDCRFYLDDPGKCPICEEQIENYVRIYDPEEAEKARRQL